MFFIIKANNEAYNKKDIKIHLKYCEVANTPVTQSSITVDV